MTRLHEWTSGLGKDCAHTWKRILGHVDGTPNVKFTTTLCDKCFSLENMALCEVDENDMAGEPELPEGVALGEDGLHQVAYKAWGKLGGVIDIAAVNWTPSQLRAIADHMEWTQRQAAKREADRAAVSREMETAAYAAFEAHDRENTKTYLTGTFLRPRLVAAIAAALRAMKTEN